MLPQSEKMESFDSAGKEGPQELKRALTKRAKFVQVFKLYQAGYSVNAISILLKKRKDAILQKLASEIVLGRVEAVSPQKTIIDRLPKNLLEDFPNFSTKGPFLVEYKDEAIVISSFNHTAS